MMFLSKTRNSRGQKSMRVRSRNPYFMGLETVVPLPGPWAIRTGDGWLPEERWWSSSFRVDVLFSGDRWKKLFVAVESFICGILWKTLEETGTELLMWDADD